MLAAKDRPAETVDDADHGVEGIEESPFFRNDAARKADRRDIEAKLDDEGNDVAEVAVFDVERGKPEAEAEGGAKGEHEKKRQGKQSASQGTNRYQTMRSAEDDERDEEVDEAHDNRARWDDQTREIDLWSACWRCRSASCCLGQGIGKELPWEHGRIIP